MRKLLITIAAALVVVGYAALSAFEYVAVRAGWADTTIKERCEKLLRATYPDLAQQQEFMEAGVRACFVIAKTKATGKVPE